MALTDYVAPSVLAEEGYIHKSCQSELLGNLDREFMAEEGWVNLNHARDVEVSVHKASQIIGCTSPTLEGYIKLGYLRKTASGNILLIAALSFDYKKVKRDYLDSKKPNRNAETTF